MTSQCDAFYSLARRSVIDVLRPDGRGQYSGRTLEEIRTETPDTCVADLDFAYRAIEDCFVQPVRSATNEEFLDALACLPPHQWVRAEDSESFKMVERTYGSITQIWVRIGDRYFTFADRMNLSHLQILEKVVSHLDALEEEA